MALGAVRIQDLHRWRPLRAEALESFWLFFDVNLDWDEISIDKALDSRIRVHLGIQPSASSSHGSCIEIHQQGTLAGSCICQRDIDILIPFN